MSKVKFTTTIDQDILEKANQGENKCSKNH